MSSPSEKHIGLQLTRCNSFQVLFVYIVFPLVFVLTEFHSICIILSLFHAISCLFCVKGMVSRLKPWSYNFSLFHASWWLIWWISLSKFRGQLRKRSGKIDSSPWILKRTVHSTLEKFENASINYFYGLAWMVKPTTSINPSRKCSSSSLSSPEALQCIVHCLWTNQIGVT